MENSKKIKKSKPTKSFEKDDITKNYDNSSSSKETQSKQKINVKQTQEVKETKQEVKETKQTKKEVNNNEQIIKLKAKITELEKKIINLETQNIAQRLENQKNIHDFQSKAKDFQTKASAQVNKIKDELNAKYIQDQEHVKKYSLQKFFESIIKPFTNLTQAIAFGTNSDDHNVKAYVIGFEMYINQLLSTFNDFGIIEIKPSVGDEFNPEIHEAIAAVEGHNKNYIVEVKQNGFKFNDRVIKPADVIVGK